MSTRGLITTDKAYKADKSETESLRFVLYDGVVLYIHHRQRDSYEEIRECDSIIRVIIDRVQ